MNPLLVGVALAVTAGAVTAVSARDARAALVGTALALGAAPFLSDPLPQLSTLATRVVGAALAAYLLRAAVAAPLGPATSRPRGAPGGSRLGWPAEALLAAAAWVVGVNLAAGLATLGPAGAAAPGGDLVAMLTPAAMATAAGLASMVVAIVPAFAGRDALRTGIGALVLLQGVLLLGTGVAGAPGDLEQLAGVTLLVATASAVAWLIGAEARRLEAATDRIDEPGEVALEATVTQPARRATR